jgi:hypothetical protein
MRKTLLLIAALVTCLGVFLPAGMAAQLNSPVLVSPEDSASGQPIPVVFRWNSVLDATQYELQISTDTNFASMEFDSSSIADTSIEIGTEVLQREVIYYWRVRSIKHHVESNWSDIRYFETLVTPPLQPQLAYPYDGAEGISLYPVLYWSGGGINVTYRVQAAFDLAFTQPVFDKSGITIDSQQVTPSLSYETTYYWRVNATNPGGTSQWSHVRSFVTRTVSGLPRAPRLLSPSNGAVNEPTTVALSWNPVTGATTYELQVALVSNFSILSFDNPAVSTTSQGIDLPRYDTTYYWRVRGNNPLSDWSATWKFRTVPEIPEIPVLQSPFTGAVNQQQTVKLYWSESPRSVAYELQVSTNLSFFPKIVDSTLTGVDTLTIGPLSFNTGYFWRVRAWNAGGWSDFSSVWNFSTVAGTAPVAVTLSAEDISYNSAKLQASVIANGDTTRVQFQYDTTASGYKNAAVASPSVVLGTASVAITSTLQGLIPNRVYHYRVIAVNRFGTSNGADQTFTTTIPPYPQTMKVKKTVNFPKYASPSDYKATDYRLIGLPGAGNTRMDSIMQGSHNTDWQLYWDSGASSNGIIAYNGSATFKSTAGRAFWCVHRGTWSIDTTFVSAALNADQSVNIPLHSGWNLITNPFDSTIAWSRIQAADTLTQPIFTYNGKFDTTLEFQPYVGYYFFNAGNRSYLKIPYVSIYQAEQSSNVLPPTEWSVQIVVSSGTNRDEISWAGVTSSSRQQIIKQNIHKPLAFSSGPQVIFNRPEWDSEYNSFATDIRSPFDTMETWAFDVHADSKLPLHLSFAGLNTIPAGFQAYLVDRSRGTVIDLRKNAAYDFRPDVENSEFELVVGLESAARNYLNSVPVPRMLALGKNYPNPFNPATTIPVEIPSSTRMSIKIFNILGQEVKTLFDGTIDAGFYSFNWDGQDQAGRKLPSGVYFCCLESPMSRTVVQKMLMMK